MYCLMSARSMKAESGRWIRCIRSRTEIICTYGSGQVGRGHDEHILLILEFVKLRKESVDDLTRK